METIWKFPLRLTDRQKIKMPGHSKVVSVQIQGGNLAMWAIVNTESTSMDREIVLVGTGHELPRDVAWNDHIGTVQDGSFVWHLFLKQF